MGVLNSCEIEPEVVEYLNTPPSAEELLELCNKLNLPAVDIIRFKESLFSEMNLSLEDKRSDEEWCKLLSENPILIQRPIVVIGDKAVLGRPAEKVLTIIEKAA